MDELSALISQLVDIRAHKIVLSGPASGEARYKKITLTRRDSGFFCEQLTAQQAFHRHLREDEIAPYLLETLPSYTQLNAWSDDTHLAARRTKKGKLIITRQRAASAPAPADSHNARKRYLLPEGDIVPPLVDMGVMTAEGKIIKAMHSKYRQINRYLEMIDDILPGDTSQPLRIVDFGCGKSYLTFVVYYYLTRLRGLRVTMVGVDLKADVIAFCNGVAAKYDYAGLRFVHGDIADYTPEGPVDMVISLHACDTATDHVLYHAVRWRARYILSVPCCHHEVAGQMDMASLPAFGVHGILRERFASLLTDAIRADLLAAGGYRTQLMEFVDLCDTPKNILIRAVDRGIPQAHRQAALARAQESCDRFAIWPTLCRLMHGAGLLPLRPPRAGTDT